MTGGNHKDMFAFTEIGGADRIIDFNRGAATRSTSARSTPSPAAPTMRSPSSAPAPSAASPASCAPTVQGGNIFVAGDVNGDGVADFTIQTNHADAGLGLRSLSPRHRQGGAPVLPGRRSFFAQAAACSLIRPIRLPSLSRATASQTSLSPSRAMQRAVSSKVTPSAASACAASAAFSTE